MRKQTFFKIRALLVIILATIPMLAGVASCNEASGGGTGGTGNNNEEQENLQDDGVVRILAIGNSFSQDAVEQYLWNLADAAGYKVVIGNMYIGGCTLATHLANVSNDAGAYAYRKIVNGAKSEKNNFKLSEAIAEEPWDYISLQQESGNSGRYETFAASLPALANYVRSHATNEDMKLMLHQTWAYAKNSNHSGFANYDRDQTTMYNAIVDAYGRAADFVDIDIVIPAGTAIQNGRTSYLGDTFCRDGYHLEVNYGRYTAACTWFEKIFGESAVGNSYFSASVSTYDAEIAQHAAHAAVQKPNGITELTDYKKASEADDLTQGAIYIDFGNGSSTSPSPWNNVTSISSSAPVSLIDSDGSTTDITITVTKPFGGINASGPGSTTTIMPSAASSDSFWGNTGVAFDGKVTGETQLTVASLDMDKEYEFTFFSSRTGVTNNRETQFTVTGTNSDVLLLNASGNISLTVTTKAIAPAENGKIIISMTSGPANNDTNGFFYLNAMSLVSVQ